MKTLLPLLLAMTLGLLPGWCGGLINLNNNFTLPGSSHKAFVLGADGQPLAKALGRVEILDATGALIRSGGLAANGLFFFGVTEIPGTVPGGSGSIIIRAWDSSTGDRWETAGIKMGTVVVLFDLGGGGAPPRGLSNGSDFNGLAPVISPWPLPPRSWISGFEFAGTNLTVKGTSTLESYWVLEWSEDLLRWSRFADQIRQSAVLQWTLPKPTSDTGYLRVVLDP
ncbi:MAG: hypothetical protein J0L84_19250 [Verrucomicrobia bacterium]|nr:hypothetical protein [Verrucomicrobiota bacterium]